MLLECSPTEFLKAILPLAKKRKELGRVQEIVAYILPSWKGLENENNIRNISRVLQLALMIDNEENAAQLINALDENDSILITLSGHADERGTREYNLALGQRRAETVSDYLVLNGINKSRITVKSYGEEKPAVLGQDESSYAKNRRVEIN